MKMDDFEDDFSDDFDDNSGDDGNFMEQWDAL
jgi:hypothetical protein